MFKKADKLVKERGLADQVTSTDPGDLQLPPAPERPAEPTQPEQPAEPTLPAEPAAPELPAEPVAPSEQDENYQQLVEQYNTDLEAWQAECDKLNADYQAAHDEWQAECDRLNADYQKALDEYNSFSIDEAKQQWNADYEKAVADWMAECQRIAQERETQKQNYNMDYTQLLVKTIEEESAKGTKGFKDFDTLRQEIKRDYDLIAAECAKEGGFSPFHAYDSYWNHYFNYDTQGYYLRRAYRATAEFTLKRSYALLAAIYDLGHSDSTGADEDDEATRASLTTLLQNALNGIDAMPAGTSPQDVINSAKKSKDVDNKPISVHCNTFGWDITMAKVGFQCENPGVIDEDITTYKNRLHGRTVKEDLALAGITPEVIANAYSDFDCKFNWKPFGDFNLAEGIALKTWSKPVNEKNKNGSKHYFAKILAWDGTVKEITTYEDDRISCERAQRCFLELQH